MINTTKAMLDYCSCVCVCLDSWCNNVLYLYLGRGSIMNNVLATCSSRLVVKTVTKKVVVSSSSLEFEIENTVVLGAFFGFVWTVRVLIKVVLVIHGVGGRRRRRGGTRGGEPILFILFLFFLFLVLLGFEDRTPTRVVIVVVSSGVRLLLVSRLEDVR